MWKEIFLVNVAVYSICLAKNIVQDNVAKEVEAASVPSYILEPVNVTTPRPAVVTELPKPLEETSTIRRKVTYDQRQDGKFNIRADLENFMIVVIPQNPVAGASLLDLLTSSSLKRSNSKKGSGKRHQLLSPKYILSRRNEEPIHGLGLHYFNHIPSQLQHHPDNHPPAHFSEYIEGRTPYRVDISSAESDYSKLHNLESAAHQVEVLPPPPYPMHLHLMKPYHLDTEAEPSSPLLSLSQGKLPEMLNYFGHGGRRVAKAIRDHPFDFNALNTNRVLFNGGGRSYDSNHGQTITITDDHDKDDSYQIKNSIQSTDNDDDIFNSINFNNKNNNYDINNLYLTRAAGTVNLNDGPNGELILIGATEQCGPDRKRDSYGVCQFV